MRPVIDTINENERVIHLPFVITDEIIDLVGKVEGVTFSRPNPWGKYELGYEIGKCFESQLIDKNVIFTVDQYIKDSKIQTRE